MTAETFHDAITLLPADLIEQADRRRSSPRPALRWQRYAAMAACFALICLSSLWCLSYLRTGSATEAASDLTMAPASAQAPQMAAPKSAEDEELLRSEAIPETGLSGADEAAERAGAMAMDSMPALTIFRDGAAYPLNQEQREAIWILLNSLDFDPGAVCNCIAPITIAVSGENLYEISPEEGFVRCAQGQASLTEEQLDTLGRILTELEEK